MKLPFPKRTILPDGKVRLDWENGAFAVWSVEADPILVQYSNGERIELKDGKVVAVYAWVQELKKFT